MAKIEATGNLGGEPEIRYSPSGRPVMNVSICDSKSRKNDQGGWDTLAEQWLRVALWGDEAEHYANTLHKGDRITVFGEFYAKPFQRKDGGEGLGLEVTAYAIQPHQKRQQGNQPSNGNAGTWTPGQSGGGFGGQQQGAPGGWGDSPAEPPF